MNKKLIIEKLKSCFDPEIPIDLWNLGLIYSIDIKKIKTNYNIEILMTLTTPGCSMINIIAEDVKNKIESLESINEVKVNVTFNPPWTPDMMTDDGKIKLGFSPNNDENNQKDEWE